MDQTPKLLTEFAVPTAAQWRQEVDRLLKGASFESKMLTPISEGLTVEPIYNASDTQDFAWRNSFPGQAPFVRGSHAAGYTGQRWWIAQEISCAGGETMGSVVSAAMQNGQTAVTISLAASAGQWQKTTDWDELLAGLDLNRTPLQVFAGAQALPVAALVSHLLAKNGSSWGAWRGCVGGDLYAELAQQGTLPSSLETGFCQLANLTEEAMKHGPNLRTLLVEEAAWHEGGADLALSLGLTLASAVATLREMDARGLRPESVAPYFQFNLEIGTDFFLEMAKLRALRLLWSRILTASGVAPEKSATFVHAATSRRDQTRLAPHVNMLRATTEAMSAIMGGVNSLNVRPFVDEAGTGGRLGRRVARNVQLILQEECRLGQVTDPAGGAWYVDRLTRDLAQAAWVVFQKIEAAGGIASELESQRIQEAVKAAAETRATAVATRREVIVGVNKYPDPSALSNIAASDHRGKKTRYAPALLAGHKFADLQIAFAADEELGAVVAAMQDDGQENEIVEAIPLRRVSLPFETLQTAVQKLRSKKPSLAQVMILCLDDVASYGPRLEFAREFFAVGGFELTGDGFFTEVASAVSTVEQDGSATVVLVGRDESYVDLAPLVVTALKAAAAPPLVLLAGAPKNQATLASLGVDAFITSQCDLVSALTKITNMLEVS